jgi:hypothetical protein
VLVDINVDEVIRRLIAKLNEAARSIG